MSQTETNKPFLSVDFGEHGGRFDWMTSQEALDWINRAVTDGHRFHKGIIRRIWHGILLGVDLTEHKQRQQAQNYLNQGQPQNAEGHILNAKSQLEGLIKPYPWLLPEGAQRPNSLRKCGMPESLWKQP